MFYEALHKLAMREKPDGNRIAQMLPGEVGRQLDTSADSLWVKVAVFNKFLTPREGWIKLRDDEGELAREAEEPPRPDFDLWAFLKACVDAEILVNGQDKDTKFFVVADYLIALADIESKIKNKGSKNPLTDGVGPFQLSTSQWAEFLASPSGKNHDQHDREDGLEQTFGAAFLALKSMHDISDGIIAHDQSNNDNETAGETGPYIPSYIDVLLAHMFGTPAAIAFRIAKMKDEGGKSVTDVLKDHFPAEGDVEKLIEHRSVLLKDSESGETETIDGMLINANKLLNKELEKAYKLIEEHAPEDLPNIDGESPWLAIAEAEHKAWKDELKNENTPGGKQRVLSYFEAIDSPQTTVLPWCGAFAGFCMKKCGVPMVDEPARAANWKLWGNTEILRGQPSVPKGAVVVLAPEKGSGRSGHVGFFSRYFGADNEQVELLGGNQSDTVRLSKFARSKIVQIRWSSPAQEEAQESDDKIDAASKGKLGTLLNLIGQAESHNNYNAFFGHVSNTDNPKFTDMTVSEVLDWQRGRKFSAAGKYQFIRKTLNGLRVSGVVKASDIFNEDTQDKLAIELLKRRKIGQYISNSIDDVTFMINLAKEWASLPVPVNMKGHKRSVTAGQSYYAGDGVNKALIGVETVRAAIRTVLS